MNNNIYIINNKQSDSITENKLKSISIKDNPKIKN